MPIDDLRIPSAERLLIAALDELDLNVDSAIITSLGRAQLAREISDRIPDADVACWFLDLYPAQEARELLTDECSRVHVVCAADLPTEPVDLAAVPISRGGEREFSRDLLQQAFDRLKIGGTLITAVDNFKDTWLQHEIEKLQKGVTRMPSRWGVAYRLVKKQLLKKRKDFACEFAFRDGERLVQAVSRPGVFSHRELDLGARALLETVTVEQGSRVLDMGCGCAPVGLAAALRAEGVHVHAIDSNARAVECALAGAQRNGVAERFTGSHDAEGRIKERRSYDLVVGNPPYYSHYTIAELFLQTAKAALKPGGRVQMVTKQSEWFVARMQQLFDDVTEQPARGYLVVGATQR
ncbi:MAG: class I SAM-dependent methyltransferase [Planctomycetaceae bacterium]